MHVKGEACTNAVGTGCTVGLFTILKGACVSWALCLVDRL